MTRLDWGGKKRERVDGSRVELAKNRLKFWANSILLYFILYQSKWVIKVLCHFDFSPMIQSLDLDL